MKNPNQEKYGDQTKNSEGSNFGGSANTHDVVNTSPPSPCPANTPGPQNINKPPMPMGGGRGNCKR